MYDFTLLRKQFDIWNIPLATEQEKLFTLYYQMLIERNRVMNLTTITEWEDVCTKHILDSAAVLSLSKEVIPSFQEKNLIDIGSGAGFPGLVLKILSPSLNITLLDSLLKRVRFLNEVIDELHLNQGSGTLQNVSRETFCKVPSVFFGCRAIHGRAEEIGSYKKEKADKSRYQSSDSKDIDREAASFGAGREKFDIVTARAVSDLRVLSEYALPLLRHGGVFCAYKSAGIDKELKAAERAVSLLGGSVQTVTEYMLPLTDIGRSLVIIQKVRPTPPMYPRPSALIKKKVL